jgi:hypothetical protein
LPNLELNTIRNLPNDVLVNKLAGWAPGTADRIKFEWVLWERKNEWTAHRAWLSLAVSLGSLVVAVFALLR